MKIFTAKGKTLRNPNWAVQLLVTIIHFASVSAIITGLFLYFTAHTLPVSDTRAIVLVITGVIAIVVLMQLNTISVDYKIEILEKVLRISKDHKEYNIPFSELILTDYHYDSKTAVASSFNISILSNQQETLFLFFSNTEAITSVLRERIQVIQEQLANYERRYSSYTLLLENRDTLAYGSRNGENFSNFKFSMRRSGKKENKIATSDLVIPPLEYQES